MAVFGTRPEAIKMAPVILELQSNPKFKVTSVVTAQHREILDQVLELFHIKPDFDLNTMKANQTLTGITVRVLQGLESVLQEQRPDILLVQGDTSTAFVGGLAAFYHKIPVGHIEAGLRTDKIYDPFPEEMNRRLLSRLAEMQFPPTKWAYDNLCKEGLVFEDTYITGNTVADALKLIVAKLPEGLPSGLKVLPPWGKESAEPDAYFTLPVNSHRRLILVETHRRENLGRPMEQICSALKRLIEAFDDIEIIFSVHPNPKVREVICPAMQGMPRVHLLEPVPYTSLLRLMRASHLIMTDSGGIQEEAPSLGVPVVVLRETTERPEGIESGNAVLAGCNEDKVFALSEAILSSAAKHDLMAKKSSPYGDGLASRRISAAILHKFFPQDYDAPKPFIAD
ncbi:MAG: non-hydrolyzing UDP-N-acetylglucosamine 2-epimerase [Candidatus Bruticola sp.]